MNTTLMLVKNMVCRRCIWAVEQILHTQGIPYQQVVLGEIHWEKPPPPEQVQQLVQQLVELGFEPIDNRNSSLVEKIKQQLLYYARREGEAAHIKTKLSVFLAEALHHEYTYLSSLFSAIEGRTIENYYIEQRIEKAKELLVYDQLSLSEIADQLGYSSVAHVSAQFKKVTGLTPTYFKEIGQQKRKGLDTV